MKILCIQHRQMGDVMMTTPAVRQLRALYPEAEIVFMSEPLGANVYENNPHISRLWIVARKMSFWAYLKLLWQVYKERFDITIDFFSNPKSAQITIASRAKRRIGFDFRGRRHAYTDRVKIPKEIAYAAQAKNALIVPLGGVIGDDRIEFAASQQAKLQADQFVKKHCFGENTIAFCVVSRREYKLLPPEFFARVAKWLLERGYKLYFVYGPNEKPMAEAVYDLLDKEAGTKVPVPKGREAPKAREPSAEEFLDGLCLDGKFKTNEKTGAKVQEHFGTRTLVREEEVVFNYEMPNIQESRAILESCKAYIGTDGGNKHLSICAGIPTLTIFNVVQASNWTPPNDPKHRAIQADGKSVDELFFEFLQNFQELA